jgi:polyisoprenoid-binding protein YceI
MTTNQWQFDMQHSGISFTVRHLLVSKVRGRFTKWSGLLRFDEDDPARSFVHVQIDAGSVDTGEPQRDAHLRSADFLDVESFPFITFMSTKVEPRDERSFAVRGELTIRGVIRPVVLSVEYGGAIRDPWGNDRAGFTAKTALDRKEFGITFNQVLDHGGLALGEKISIDLDIEATRVAQQAASTAA